jgi:hypothetical protein
MDILLPHDKNRPAFIGARARARAYLSILLAVLLGSAGATRVWPQELAPQTAAAANLAVRLRLLDPEDATRRIKSPFQKGIEVQVSDGHLRPIPAEVEVTLSGDAAGAELGNGEKSVKVALGPDGKYLIDGLRANRFSGAFQIVATATFGGESARGVLPQTNMPPPYLVRHRNKFLIAGAAAAIAVVATFALRKTPPPSITIGSSGSGGPVGRP